MPLLFALMASCSPALVIQMIRSPLNDERQTHRTFSPSPGPHLMPGTEKVLSNRGHRPELPVLLPVAVQITSPNPDPPTLQGSAPVHLAEGHKAPLLCLSGQEWG